MSIDYTVLSELERRFGPSFYLYNPDVFKQNYEEFLAAFQAVYPKTAIGYSYKTNYLPEVCNTVNELGGYAEVVSIMEYELARRIGVSPDRIIFNGPYKTKEHLRIALRNGSIVNIDNAYEATLVEELATEIDSGSLKVGVRCNIDIGADHPSRFGFDILSSEFRTMTKRLSSHPNCSLVGIHCHYIPPRRSVEEYGIMAEKMVELAHELFEDGNPAYIDLGGGYFSPYNPALHNPFSVPIPKPEDYARTMATPLAKAFPDGNGPILLLEPGMSLIADAVQFITKVIDIKTVRSRTVALVSASVYDTLPNKTGRNLPVTRVASSQEQQEPVADTMDIVGYTCMEDDILHYNYAEPLHEGDYLVFDNVGAYTIVLKPPFILTAPPVVSFNGQLEDVQVIRRAETLDDVFATYVFPDKSGPNDE